MLICVGGCERSGTTLLGALLALRGESVVCAPESQAIMRSLHFLNRLGCDAEAIEREVKRINADKKFRLLWGIEVQVPSVKLARPRDLYFHVVSQYVRAHFKNVKYSIVVDQNPGNFRELDFIESTFEEVRFVHIFRDGRANFASVRDLDWGPNDPKAAAEWWLRSLVWPYFWISRGRQIIEVKYEDLVVSPDKVLNGIFSSLGVETQLCDRNGIEMYRGGYNSKQHAKLWEQVTSSGVSRWKSKLSNRDIEIFEAIAGPMIQNLGYELYFDNPRSVCRKERLVFVLKYIFFGYPNKVLTRKKRFN